MSTFNLRRWFAGNSNGDGNGARQADLLGQVAAINKSQAVIEFKLDGTILDANENFLSAVGYSLDEIRGQHHRMFVHADERASEEYRLFWERLGRGEFDRGLYKRVGKGGREIWIEASYNPILDATGKPFKVVKYATDVTAKRIEAADHAGQLEAISKSQAVIEFNLDGTIRSANDNFLAAVGYRLDEIQGQHHRLFVDPADAESAEYRAFWAKLRNGEFDSGQYRRLGKGGREIWIEASYNPIYDLNGQPFKVVKYATDVTDKVRANQALELAVKQAAEVASSGDLSKRIVVDNAEGLVAELSAGVNAMLDTMEANQRRERDVATENLRIRNALDSVTTNVMIADNDRNIIYLNASIETMLADAESDIRKQLPEFRTEGLRGRSIDVFHKNPEHQKRMLERLTDVHRAELNLGGRTMELTVTPIFGEQGDRAGTVVEWLDRTAEVAVENEIGQSIEAANQGDFSNRISVADKQGFFLRLSEGVNSLMEGFEAGFKQVNTSLGYLADGDFTQRIEADYRGSWAELKASVNATVDQLSSLLLQIRGSSEEINSASRDVASGSNDLSARTEQTAASLEETASSMEQLTSAVRQNTENAEQANQLAVGARDTADKGGQVVREVVQRMGEITNSSREISEIISVIEGIAFQTNILALNAAVEAARAGEQGRGFAVVAGEVRSLAQRSSGAAKEIKKLISSSVDNIEKGSEMVDQAGETMAEIVSAVKRVTDIMGEITAASREQRSGIEQVNDAITHMDQGTQQNAALVEESAAAAKSMTEQADGLLQAIMRFRFDAAEPGVAPAIRGGQERIARVEPSVSAANQPARSRPEPRAALAPAPGARAAQAAPDEHWAEF